MGGPGSGRRPKLGAVNGHNGHAPAPASRVTFADLFAKLPDAPAPANADAQSSNPQTVNPVPPPAPATVAPTPPPEKSANRSFADMASYVAVNVGISVIGDSMRNKKPPLEPRELSQEDVDKTTKATADAIVRGLGDLEVPWWAGLVTAWGNLYLAMRVGAKPLKPAESAPETSTTTTTTPPPSPLGQPIPRQPPAPAPNLAAFPREIPVSA